MCLVEFKMIQKVTLVVIAILFRLNDFLCFIPSKHYFTGEISIKKFLKIALCVVLIRQNP